MEINCKLVGMMQGGKWEKHLECNRRVYSIDAISPTITTCGGGNREVKIAIPQATSQGFIECEMGGGRYELSEQQDPAWPGTRGRLCLPNDNGTGKRALPHRALYRRYKREKPGQPIGQEGGDTYGAAA